MKSLTRTTLAGLLGLMTLSLCSSVNAGDRDDRMRRLRRELSDAHYRSRSVSRVGFGVRINDDDDDDDDDCRMSRRRYSAYRAPVYTPSYRVPSVYRSNRGVSLSIGWGNGGLSVDRNRPRYVNVPTYTPRIPRNPVVLPPPAPVIVNPNPVLPPAPHPGGPVLHAPGVTHGHAAGPVHPWGSIVSDSRVPIYDRIQERNLDETHPHSIKVLVAVKDPNPCDNPYATVYVPVCIPPHLPRGMNVEVKRGGERIEMDFGDYEVDIVSCRGIVVLDYDN